MASRPFQFLEKKRSKIRKSAAKHFEGLAALSTHPAGRRAAVKAGCNPVHFSLDGCPLSCYFSGSVATTSGHFVHKSERRTRDGGFHIPAAVSHASRYNTLHFASKVVCHRGHPFGNPGQQNRRYAALSGSIPPFVVSSPFHGLRVVPCKLT